MQGSTLPFSLRCPEGGPSKVDGRLSGSSASPPRLGPAIRPGPFTACIRVGFLVCCPRERLEPVYNSPVFGLL